jgi:uncharacterized protein
VWLNSASLQAATALITSRISIVEVRSAFARRQREYTMTEAEIAESISVFKEDCTKRYSLIDVDPVIIQLASELPDQLGLRAYDSIQLASAIKANDLLIAAGLAPLVSACADVRLLIVAQKVGLLVKNLNDDALNA